MCQLLETIKCKDGQLFNLQWHNARFNQARKEYFGLSTKMNLVNFVKVPAGAKKGLYRCRINYSKTIDKVEFIPHQYKKTESLKLVFDDTIDYHLKFEKREMLNLLFEKREACDDILIVKNGCITDSYTANPIFFDGDRWWTSDTPLLEGTQRARYIAEGKIAICKITPDDFPKYTKVGLLNALQDFYDMPVIDMERVV